jgi:alkyl hydroperoxide reductase subunit AhpF
MSLLSPTDQQRLRESFSAMTARVRLLLFTQTLACESCPLAKQIVDELPALSDRITVEEVNFVLEKERAAQYGIDRVPAIAIVREDADGRQSDTRIRFMGAPAGYEFMSLIHAIELAGGGATLLSEAQQKRISEIDAPLSMQVFTTPG